MSQPRRCIFVLLVTLAGGCAESEADAPAASADLAITGATLIDGTGSAPRPETTILIRDGLIAEVVSDSDVRIPESVPVVDAAGKYVIPGLTDLHVHFSLGAPLSRTPRETETVLARKLYYGVTSILAIGTSDSHAASIRSLRSRLASGELEAPTIYGTGGHLTLQGTHPVYTISPPHVRRFVDSAAATLPPQEPVDLDPIGRGLSIVRTPEAARAAVRARAEAGMDAIKITVESGPTPFGDDHPQMSAGMIREIVEESEQNGLEVFAHVTSLDELEATLEGGAAGIVHAVWDRPLPDTALADRMAKSGFYVMPTISLYRGAVSLRYIEEPVPLDDPFLRETVSESEISALRATSFVDTFRSRGHTQLDPDTDAAGTIRRQMDDLLRNLGMLNERGVPIVLGTDTGNPYVFPGFSVHLELELLVRAGLTPMEALEAATRRAAEMLGAQREFGTVQTGRRADLLILARNPLEDIRHTRSLETVIAAGRLVDRGALPVGVQ